MIAVPAAWGIGRAWISDDLYADPSRYADETVQLFKTGNGKGLLEGLRSGPPSAEAPGNRRLLQDGDSAMFQIVASTGEVIAESAKWSRMGEHAPVAQPPKADQQNTIWRQVHKVQLMDVPSATDQPIVPTTAVCSFAMAVSAFVTDNYPISAVESLPQDATLTVCVFLDPMAVQELEQVRRWTLAGGVLAFVMIVTAVATAFFERARRPLMTLRRQAVVASQDPQGSLVASQRGGDLGAIADSFNATILRLRKSLSAQRRFVADAAHELRSPVTVLINMLEVSKAHPETVTSADDLVDRSLRHARRIEALVRDLLTLAAVDSGTERTDHIVDVGILAQETVADLPSPPGVQIAVRVDHEQNVLADPLRLRQVLENLLSNAIRHASSEVKLEVRGTDHEVVVTVVNNGTVIAEQDGERIFERFTRLDESRDRDTGGTGLGLAIVRELVEAYGGSVKLLPGQRETTFVVTLPRESAMVPRASV